MKLLLESATDSLDLDSVMTTGRGVQALVGATGLGLPPVAVQWLEGAGDGASYRGQRVLPRDIDLPLYFVAPSRAALQASLSRFARLVAGECTLRLVAPGEPSWSLKVHRVGGGQYVYGVDTIGQTDLETVITLRAGDPFWTSDRTQSQVIRPTTGANFMTNLANLKVAPGQTIGQVNFSNEGDARAFPFWTITGPGRNFVATSPTGESFSWNGTLAAGEKLYVDTQTGRVYDEAGESRYDDMGRAPRMWSVPPGLSTCIASLEATGPASSIGCQWRARKWMVV